MSVVLSFLAVVFLVFVAVAGIAFGQQYMLFGTILPYAAFAIFLVGFVYRVIKWARSPVPFRITTTCGQQKSLPWIQNDNLESPHNIFGVIGRMALEVLFFRSLFRNTKAEVRPGPQLVYGEEKFLWLGALAFHWCFLVILARHLRFFLEPVPMCVNFLQDLDGLFQITVPTVFITDAIIVGALTFLVFRRLADAKVRYISLLADYFALFLILAVVLSGIYMRHIEKVDIMSVKEMAIGLVTFKPVAAQVASSFYVHLFLVCTLLVYFPFSKLMHMAGVFLSPTRNMANDNRMNRHINPWNYAVHHHTYQEWEDEFREKMRGAGLPLEKE